MRQHVKSAPARIWESHLWESSFSAPRSPFSHSPARLTSSRSQSWASPRCWLFPTTETVASRFQLRSKPWKKILIDGCVSSDYVDLTFGGLIGVFDCAVVPRLVGSVSSSSSSGPPSTSFCLSIDLSSHSILWILFWIRFDGGGISASRWFYKICDRLGGSKLNDWMFVHFKY